MRGPLRPVGFSTTIHCTEPVRSFGKNIYWYSVIYLLIFCEAAMQNIYNAPLSEEETKLRYITPALEDAG